MNLKNLISDPNFSYIDSKFVELEVSNELRSTPAYFKAIEAVDIVESVNNIKYYPFPRGPHVVRKSAGSTNEDDITKLVSCTENEIEYYFCINKVNSDTNKNWKTTIEITKIVVKFNPKTKSNSVDIAWDYYESDPKYTEHKGVIEFNHIYYSVEKFKYNEYGINVETTKKDYNFDYSVYECEYNTSDIDSTYDFCGFENLRITPNKVESLYRDRLDTAFYHYIDNDANEEFYTVVPLDKEKSLVEMKLGFTNIKEYFENPVIEPLSVEEIEQLILREKDLNIQTGLRERSLNRENYYYDSSRDIEDIVKDVKMKKMTM